MNNADNSNYYNVVIMFFGLLLLNLWCVGQKAAKITPASQDTILANQDTTFGVEYKDDIPIYDAYGNVYSTRHAEYKTYYDEDHRAFNWILDPKKHVYHKKYIE